MLLDLDFMKPLQRPEVKHYCHVQVNNEVVGPVASGWWSQTRLRKVSWTEEELQQKVHLKT